MIEDTAWRTKCRTTENDQNVWVCLNTKESNTEAKDIIKVRFYNVGVES